MIRVEIINTFLVNTGNEFVILLRDTEDKDRTLPISIGQLEAHSIAMLLNHIPFPRPLTHDLMKEVILKMGGKVIRTEICELKDETFFAQLILQIGDKTIAIESRPSDAISLSLRFDAPVFVNEQVMDEAGVHLPSSTGILKDTDSISISTEDTTHHVEPTTIEVLRDQLKSAISQERYEDAARLRDKITKLTRYN